MATKPQVTADYQESHGSNDQRSEFETRDDDRKSAILRIAESVRLGLTVLALLAGLTILGTAAATLQVYNTTSLTTDFKLSMWPQEFDIRPTVALVTCGAIIFLSSTVSIITSKIPSIRNPLTILLSTFLFPTVSLIAGLTAISIYYGVNTSNTSYSLQTWSCQFSHISLDVKPHFGALCKESKTALYLSVMIIPLEILVLGAGVLGKQGERKSVFIREKGSPALS
ncbi:hypothetical protein B0O99DRAFT_511537 [Bisporella sp. PMI_857]|nr:hypothetical protein B0O99DRAFT_511537 [Bisporella sp. PMI_857]